MLNLTFLSCCFSPNRWFCNNELSSTSHFTMCVSWHARVASAIWWVCISDGQLCSYGITVLVFDWGLSFGTYGMQLPSSLLVSCRGWGIIYHHCLALVMKGTFMWPELARGSYQRSIYPNKTREQRKFLSNTHVEENRSPCQLSFLMDSSTPANVHKESSLKKYGKWKTQCYDE